jgi:predicted amidohydrolase
MDSVPGSPQVNLERARTQALAAFDLGADLVVLPELAIPGYVTDPGMAAAVAEPVPGPSVGVLIELARSRGGTVAFGLAESGPDRPFNSVAVVDGSGVLAVYRKLHLFAEEKHAFARGNAGLPVVDVGWGLLGICICYDVRFVEVLRVLSLRGAQLVLAPAAWVTGFDALTHDEQGMSPQARSVQIQANLDQVAVAAVSQVGRHDDRQFLGGSIAVDAYGTVIAGPLSRVEADVAVVEVDPSVVDAAQRRSDLITPRLDRRTDVYDVVYSSSGESS